ncbi:MAG: hypothetical protein ABJK59_06625 [Erythrobacter sp.]|uniref:hypothetical protein n=1 Tax=Erythrobacter sp. TaxID=1042 RepID=UPI003298B01C
MMNPTSIQISLAISLSIALAGCASADGSYPSLAVRDAERAQGTLSPSPEGASKPLESANLDSIREAATKAGNFDNLFSLEQGNVRKLIEASQGLSQESDAYAKALVGLGHLSSLRGQTAGVLAQLDQMEAQAATTFAPLDEIHEAQTRVARLIEQQDATLVSLGGQLRR